MQWVSTVSYSFLLYGRVKGDITPTRGIRQGDPLLPYIFIMCSEVLYGLYNKAQEDGSLPGIKVARNSPRLSHLLCADDTMFFCKSNRQSCQALKQILGQYEEASGQMINCQKSAVIFSSNTLQETRTIVKADLGISREGGVDKYMGFPEHFGRRKKDLFSLIVDIIRQRAISWSSKFLSTAGNIVLLKSVLAAIPTYTM